MTSDSHLLEVAPGLRRLLAPNPSPMTLEGTNTWLVGEPSEPVVVVDPGPDHPDHRARILAAAPAGIAAIWITHRHLDHTEGAPALASAADAPIYAADPDWASEGAQLQPDDEAAVAGWRLHAYPTPGHTSDSFSFLATSDSIGSSDSAPARLLTGDMVLGRGTTVITHPDGDLAAYLDSLEVMSALVRQHEVAEILPGHGPVVDDPARLLDHYRRHRLERLRQVQDALAAGARTPAEVVEVVYADVDRSVWPAAEQSVRSQLDYLEHRSTYAG